MDDLKPVSPDKNEPDVSNDPLDQPYDDKQPETYVTPNGEPTPIAPLATPLSLQKTKNHSGRWLFRGFVLVLIALLGAFGYWQWTEAQSANNERASLQSELETVKAAVKSVDMEVDTQDVVVDTKSDDELIKDEVKAHILARTDLEGKKPEVSVAENKNGFARANWTNGPKSGQSLVGINFFLKKVEQRWVVVAESPEGLTEAEYKLYGIPTGM